MEALNKKASHVPYRNSKLTYLLQDSKKNVTSKNLEETVKVLMSELKMLAKAKERSEDQLSSLNMDHGCIQDHLKSSSESRAKEQGESHTLTVLKQRNAQMTTRWKNEKQLHEKATDHTIGGLESNKITSKEDCSIVAHHKAGHSITSWFLEHADPLLKVITIPKISSELVYAKYLPKEVFLRIEEHIMHIVCTAFSGRAIEEVFFGKGTTGVSDDLCRVSGLIYSTIQVYRMSSRAGQLDFPKDSNAKSGDKPYPDSTASAMDKETRQTVEEVDQKTSDLIREKKDEVKKVANILLDKETITHDNIINSNFRVRKTQKLQSRPSNEVARKLKAAEDSPVVKNPIPSTIESEEVRGKLLEMLRYTSHTEMVNLNNKENRYPLFGYSGAKHGVRRKFLHKLGIDLSCISHKDIQFLTRFH